MGEQVDLSNEDVQEALLTVGALLVGYRTATWLVAQPQPQAIVDALTTPMLSPVDIVEIAAFLAVLYAVVWMVAYGPRPRA